jgi:hypothetical protein
MLKPEHGIPRPSRTEWTIVLGLLVLVVFSAVMPSLEQPAAYHAFADHREIAGVANGANVLSNVAFAVAALAIALGLLRQGPLQPVTRAALAVAALGLALTAAGSAYYHATPDDDTLFWDRLPITISFAGVVGAAAAQRVSSRMGAASTIGLALLGPVTVLYWRASENLMPYILLQAGASLALLLIVLVTARRADPLPWWWLIGWYVAAKIAEVVDVPIFNWTGGAISGHTLKHLFAAVGAAGLALPLWRAPPAAPASG